jgi:hypothetical protein
VTHPQGTLHLVTTNLDFKFSFIPQGWISATGTLSY